MKNNGSNGMLVFAGRNIKEIMRSPVSWGFGLAMPLAIFIIIQAIMKSIGAVAEETTPMFAVGRFTGGVVIFSASFLSLFSAMLISADRSESFLNRLFSSPLSSTSYIMGYVLGVLPVAAAQVVITFVTALCFGLPFTPGLLVALVSAMLISLLFIAIGMIFGSLLSAKGAPPLCSAVVQVAALLSGMWFDLDMIGGGFSVFCHVLPFAHGYDLIRYALAGEWGNMWLPVLVVIAYTAALFIGGVLCFNRKRRG